MQLGTMMHCSWAPTKAARMLTLLDSTQERALESMLEV